MKQNQATIHAIKHKRANSWPSLTFSSIVEKHWPLSRGYFGSWGHALVAVAVVERWPLWTGLIRVNREIKIHVYGKRQTSDLSWEFLRIENK